jgi:sulfur-oxidizing protein SoxB
MHEESHHVLVGKNGTLLVEEGQDGTQVGELTVRVAGGKMRSHSFIAHRISTRNNRPDPGIAALIEKVRAPFVKGAAFRAHSNPINGAVLRTPIDTIVGYTETPLQRANFAGSKGDNAVIEGSSHDFLADAFRASCNADLGIIRGFRYGTQVAGSVAAPGPIRLEDLYHYIPIGPQIACGKVSGDDIRLMVERDAASSLSSWVDSWGGGWLTAFSGLSYDLDPANEAGWRVTNLRVGNAPIDLEKYYSIGGYWYVDNPDRINRAPMLDIRVLRDSNGDVLDATDIVAHYLLSLPDHTVRVDGGRVHLVQPLPKPIGLDREIQPLRGAPRPDY